MAVRIAAAPRKRRRMARPEQDIHIPIAQYLDLVSRLYGFWYTHFPAGGARTRAEGGILKAMGLKPGVGDLMFVKAGRVYFIELKPPGKKQSDNQIAFERAMHEQACPYAVAHSLDEVIGILRAWMLIPCKP